MRGNVYIRVLIEKYITLGNTYDTYTFFFRGIMMAE